MKKYIPHFILLQIGLFFSTLLHSQTISREVNCSSGETLSNGDLSISFVLGELIGDQSSNPLSAKYLTSGFSQPDIELQEILQANPGNPFTVYPNPSRGGMVKLAFNDIPEAIYKIEIFDPLGRLLQTKTVIYSKDEFQYVDLDVSSFSKGIYFIMVKSNLNLQGQVKLIKI